MQLDQVFILAVFAAAIAFDVCGIAYILIKPAPTA